MLWPNCTCAIAVYAVACQQWRAWVDEGHQSLARLHRRLKSLGTDVV